MAEWSARVKAPATMVLVYSGRGARIRRRNAWIPMYIRCHPSRSRGPLVSPRPAVVNAMNTRVMDAYTRIDAVTSNLDETLGEKLDKRLKEAVSDAKVEETLTKVTDGVFANRSSDIEIWTRQAIRSSRG